MKYTVIIGLIVVFIVLAMLGCEVKKLKEQNQVLKHTSDSTFNQATLLIDKHGRLVARAKTYEMELNTFRRLNDELDIDKKQLKEQVGRLSNLVGYWKGQAGFKGRDTVTLTNYVFLDNGMLIDSVKKFAWTNKYLTIDETIYRDDTVTIDYSYDIGGFDLTAYYQKRAFRKKQLVTDLKFGDPNLRVREFTGVVIKQPKKKFWETQWFAALVGFGTGTWINR